MADMQMTWSGDLSVSATGDLAISDGPALGTERVLRRLMTNPGDYIWNPEYGAGLGTFVGRPADPAGIEALVRQQMAIEAAVAPVPEPVIAVQADASGQMFVQVRYADATSTQLASVSLNISG